MYQSAGTSCPSAQSMRSVELLTVTVLFGGSFGGPPTTLIARPYRLKTTVPIALSTSRGDGADAVDVISALAGAAKATAEVSGSAMALLVAATTLRRVASTLASGWTVVSVAGVDSVVIGASDSGFAV